MTSALRTMGRQSGAQMLGFGTPQGFLPLRQQMQTRLEELEIGASTEQIVMVSGVTQAIDLIARIFVKPGDAVIVGDPAWFQMFGRFVSQGARLVGMPYTPDGPDLDALESIVQTWRPKMLVINSVLQNPDRHVADGGAGVSHSATRGNLRFHRRRRRYLRRSVPADFPGTRLASLDQLKRVIFLGSFSKTLAPNLRVGFIAVRAGGGQGYQRSENAGRHDEPRTERARAVQDSHRRPLPAACRTAAREARRRARKIRADARKRPA